MDVTVQMDTIGMHHRMGRRSSGPHPVHFSGDETPVPKLSAPKPTGLDRMRYRLGFYQESAYGDAQLAGLVDRLKEQVQTGAVEVLSHQADKGWEEGASWKPFGPDLVSIAGKHYTLRRTPKMKNGLSFLLASEDGRFTLMYDGERLYYRDIRSKIALVSRHDQVQQRTSRLGLDLIELVKRYSQQQRESRKPLPEDIPRLVF